MVVIQNSLNDSSFDKKYLSNTLQQVLEYLGKSEHELLVRLVDKAEIQALNKTYRHQDKPTNVLSFPSDLPIEITEHILGDVVICLEIVREQARAQNKSFAHHLMHMAVHGTLHLLDYDHINDADGEKMEGLEVKILQKIGIPNPYVF